MSIALVLGAILAAACVFLAGALVALWPDAREQRRLAARYALAEA